LYSVYSLTSSSRQIQTDTTQLLGYSNIEILNFSYTTVARGGSRILEWGGGSEGPVEGNVGKAMGAQFQMAGHIPGTLYLSRRRPGYHINLQLVLNTAYSYPLSTDD